MGISHFLELSVAAILVENFVLVKFYGICPFLGVSKKTDTALGMGMAVTFVMSLASALTWLVYHYILVRCKDRPGSIQCAGNISAPHNHKLCGFGSDAFKHRKGI